MRTKEADHMQALTLKVRLYPTKQQEFLLETISNNYISCINQLVAAMVSEGKILKLTSKTVIANLPSAVKNQAIRDAKSVFRKAKKTKFETIPHLKKPVCIWNNQNYSVESGRISMPFIVGGKSKRISIKTSTINRLELLDEKRGTLRITRKSNRWIAQISVSVDLEEAEKKVALMPQKTMGVDLGLKVPAVAVTEDGKTKFFGNGRQNKYMKRKFRSKRKKLGVAKKQKAIDRLGNKEQRWMTDQDHKTSKAIVDFAIKNNVSVIKLEQLDNIRSTARTSRKNEKNLHTWSFYRLSQFIEYKAKLNGISVLYVDPAYTSQTYPACGARHKAKDRTYACDCGFTAHRDRVGAMNIIHAPVIDDQSLSA